MQQALTAMPGLPIPYGDLGNFVKELFGKRAIATFDSVDQIVEEITEMLTPYIRGDK